MVGRWGGPAADGLGHHALQSEGVVVRAREEVLLGVVVLPQTGAMGGQGRAQVRTVPSGQHQFVRVPGIAQPDHLEFEIGREIAERARRMGAVVGGTAAAPEAASSAPWKTLPPRTPR